jgi:glycerophosphoryl diester phosphodiesterase
LRLIAHRGASRERPENTLSAFRRALELDADGIELDVHATRDGVVVVHHDPVPRGAPDEGALAGRALVDLSLDEVARFRLGGSERIPTLEEVLTVVDGGADVYVEIKAPAIEAAVVDVIRRSPAPARCAVHSFDHRVPRNVRALAPEIRTGILLTSYLLDPGSALRQAGASDLWQQWELIDPPLVALAHEAGARVIAWTVNDPRRARLLADWGVDAICTDTLPTIRQE